MIAQLRPLDEPSLVHGHLAPWRDTDGRAYSLWRRRSQDGSTAAGTRIDIEARTA